MGARVGAKPRLWRSNRNARRVMLTILTALAVLAAPPQSQAAKDNGWTVAVVSPEGKTRNAEPECHPLKYFSDPKNLNRLTNSAAIVGPLAPGLTYQTFATSQHLGEIAGFAIDQVMIRVNETYSFETQPFAAMKMIVVERKHGEFCQVFSEAGRARDVDADGEAAIIRTGAETMLASGRNSRVYWRFGKDGPARLEDEHVAGF